MIRTHLADGRSESPLSGSSNSFRRSLSSTISLGSRNISTVRFSTRPTDIWVCSTLWSCEYKIESSSKEKTHVLIFLAKVLVCSASSASYLRFHVAAESEESMEGELVCEDMNEKTLWRKSMVRRNEVCTHLDLYITTGPCVDLRTCWKCQSRWHCRTCDQAAAQINSSFVRSFVSAPD